MNILSKNRFLLMSVFLGLLTIGLPGHIPPVHATPNSATSCVSTDCPLSGIKSQSFSDPGNGYAASETKFDQPSGYSDGQMTGYGGNSPNIWIGVEAGLGSGLRGLSNPNENIRTVEIDVSITDSSGNAFPLTASTLAAGTSVWDTPYPSGVSIDYASLITDLSGFVAGLVGVTVPPGIHFSVETPNGHNVVGNTFIAVWTGYPNPCQITSISNSCSSTGNTSNDSTKQVDKTLNVRVIPTFSSPDVYKFTISTRVERGDCYWSTVGDPRSGQVANSYYCRSLETLTQSYSFYYVYENEAGLNSDAADALPNAGGIVSVLQRGTYAGLLYRIDSVDVYGYSATAGEPLAFVETSPSTGDYSLTVYDNSSARYHNARWRKRSHQHRLVYSGFHRADLLRQDLSRKRPGSLLLRHLRYVRNCSQSGVTESRANRHGLLNNLNNHHIEHKHVHRHCKPSRVCFPASK